MYFATHFLHQCLLGVMTGISISKYLVYDNFSCELARKGKLLWIIVWFSMIILVLMLYWIPKLMNVDPMLSVKLVRQHLKHLNDLIFINYKYLQAFEYCLDPFHPRPETTVMFGCIRCIALVCSFWFYAPLNKKYLNLFLKLF